MENQKSKTGPVNKRKKKAKSRPKNSKRLTVMVFKSVGKIKTFDISSRLLIWASLFFIFYIIATIFLTNIFIDYYRENRILLNENSELRATLTKTKKILEESKQHVALLDEYIAEKKEQNLEPLPMGDHSESVLSELVDIDELEIKRNESIITVNFRIINKQLDEQPIGGYIFILARIKYSDESEVWVYPDSQLKDGIPENYESGQRFLIQNFKVITCKYALPESKNRALIFEILVYDTEGALIFKKSFEQE